MTTEIIEAPTRLRQRESRLSRSTGRPHGQFSLASIYIYAYMYIWLWIKTLVVAGPPPLLQTFTAGPLLQTLVADLCVEYCSLQGACRGGVWS